MSSFRIRPRFEQIVPFSLEKAGEIIRTKLQSPEAPCKGLVIPGYITLSVHDEEKHFWSPQLSLWMEEHPEGTLIQGLYGPNPSVWALFFYGYAALGILATFIGIIGFSQYSLGKNAAILWVLPVLLSLAIGLYIAAQMGQKLGAEQTYMLHHFYEDAIGTRASIN